jgi:hypothetical protein
VLTVKGSSATGSAVDTVVWSVGAGAAAVGALCALAATDTRKMKAARPAERRNESVR